MQSPHLRLTLLFLTLSMPPLEASPCSCNGFTSSKGRGECKTIYRGKPWCYIDDDANCSDRMESQTKKGWWSFKACRQQISESSACSCNGVTSSRGGECTRRYKGRPWCYVSPEAGCRDKKASETVEGGSWSFQACRDTNSKGLGCETKRGQLCVFPFKFKGRVFSSCTTTDSVNGRPWCAVRVDGGGNVVTNKWEDCQVETCGEASVEDQIEQAFSEDCRVETLGDGNGGRGCIFPFNYKNETYKKCTMDGASRAWCATKVDDGGRVGSKGDCSEDISSVDCFPDEFWDNIAVFNEGEDGTIPCEHDNDCPNYDVSIMRSILGLSDVWEPYMSCDYPIINQLINKDLGKMCILHEGTQLGCGVDFEGNLCNFDDPAPGCNVDINGEGCVLFVGGGHRQRYTTSGASQSFLAGQVDLSRSKFNRERRKESRVRGSCRSRSTCRRGDFCCPIVWAGSNRQFICPRYC